MAAWPHVIFALLGFSLLSTFIRVSQQRLVKTQDFNKNLFNEAVLKTSEHRGTTHIFEDIQKIISVIENSKDLKKLWDKYKKNYSYAKDISFEDIVYV